MISKPPTPCEKCGTMKSLKKNGFCNGKPAYAYVCKPCRKIYNREQQLRTWDRILENKKKRYWENPEKFREKSRKYVADNKEEVLAAYKEYRKKYPERVRETKRRWNQSEKGKESIRKSSAKIREKNKEDIRLKKKLWNASPEGKISKAKAFHNRRAAKLKSPDRLTSKDIRRIKARFPDCVYCGVVDAEKTLDHIVPLRDMGAHAIWNIVTSCRLCNNQKTYLTLDEWAARSGKNIFPMPQPLTKEA